MANINYPQSHRNARPVEKRGEFYENVLKKITAYLPKKKKIKILDSGCGIGLFSSLLKSNFPSSEVISIDLDKLSLESAKKRGLKVIKADLQKKLPFNDNTFDIIISNQVLEHMLNPDFYLMEHKRILKKESGIFVITTPNLAAWFNRIIFLFGIQPFFLETSTIDKTVGLGFTRGMTPMREPMQHIRVFTYGALKDIAALHGLRIINSMGLEAPYLPKPMNLIDKFISGSIMTLASNLIVVVKK